MSGIDSDRADVALFAAREIEAHVQACMADIEDCAATAPMRLNLWRAQQLAQTIMTTLDDPDVPTADLQRALVL